MFTYFSSNSTLSVFLFFPNLNSFTAFVAVKAVRYISIKKLLFVQSLRLFLTGSYFLLLKQHGQRPAAATKDSLKNGKGCILKALITMLKFFNSHLES